MANEALSSKDGIEARRSPSLIAAGAMLVVGLAAGAAIAILPGVLSAFVASGDATSSQSPTLGAAELTGITLSMLGSGLLLARVDRWRVAAFSVAAIGIGQLISVWPHSIDFLLATRLCVGLAEGALIATVTASIASTASPERLFALWLSLNLIVAAAFYAALPLLLSPGQFKGAMCALTGLAVVGALALPWFPHTASSNLTSPAKVRSTAESHRQAAPAILALLASLTLFVGIGSVWPLMPQIGRSNHVDVATITGALSAASFAGVASGLLTSWLGLRVGRSIPIIVGTLGLSVAMFSLLMSGSYIFVFAALSFLAWWVANSTYYIGVVAALDRSGRLATLTFAVQFLGLTAGQYLSAALLQSGASYPQLLIVGASLPLVALLLIMSALRSSVSHVSV